MTRFETLKWDNFLDQLGRMGFLVVEEADDLYVTQSVNGSVSTYYLYKGDHPETLHFVGSAKALEKLDALILDFTDIRQLQLNLW